MADWKNRITRHGEDSPSALMANPLNARRHPQAQRDALGGMLDEIGWVQDVIVNERTGLLVDGHLRVELAIERGEATVPVVYVDLDEREERLVLATLDPLAALAETDDTALLALLESFEAEDDDLRAMLADMKPQVPTEGKTDPDDVPRQRETDVQRGQVYQLGAHRLMCGDATDEGDVARLWGEVTPDAVLTDPPYGVGVDYAGDFVDDLDSVAELIAGFMPSVLLCRSALITSGHAAMHLYPDPVWVLAWIHPAGVGSGPWGFTTFHPVLAYGSDPYLARGLGGRPDSIVMATDRQGVDGHPVAKPLEVWEWLLVRVSADAGDCIYDPFVGSGTTLIAAERTGRACYAMEIEPAYVQVSIDRWEQFTGETAVLLDG